MLKSCCFLICLLCISAINAKKDTPKTWKIGVVNFLRLVELTDDHTLNFSSKNQTKTIFKSQKQINKTNRLIQQEEEAVNQLLTQYDNHPPKNIATKITSKHKHLSTLYYRLAILLKKEKKATAIQTTANHEAYIKHYNKLVRLVTKGIKEFGKTNQYDFIIKQQDIAVPLILNRNQTTDITEEVYRFMNQPKQP